MPALNATSQDAIGLMRFLAQVQSIKAKKVRDVKSYTDKGEVLWLSSIAGHDAILSDPSAAPGDPFLIVHKLPEDPSPDVPKTLTKFVKGPTTSFRTPPTFPQITDESEQALIDARDTYLVEWELWSEEAKRNAPIHALYKKLFSIRNTVAAKGDSVEILLAAGLLAWHPAGHDPVRRHLITAPIEISLNSKTGAISASLAETVTHLNAEFDMLDSSVIPSASIVQDARSLLRAQEVPGFSRNLVGSVCNQIVNQLHPDGQMTSTPVTAEPDGAPTVALAPAIILRNRKPSDLSEVFHTIAARIENTNSVPQGLMPLVDPDLVPPAMPESSPGAIITHGDDFYAPLPLNETQKQIIDRVDNNAQTLVQGPPGTGKTHTAAALISHLLAQGKRVLVTAETDRALYEVRDKLPSSIQDLAVSVIGHSTSEQSQLSRSIQHISRVADNFNSRNNSKKIRRETDRVKKVLKERDRLLSALENAYEAAGTSADIEGFDGTHGELVRFVAEHHAEHEWIVKDKQLRYLDASTLDVNAFLKFLTDLRHAVANNGTDGPLDFSNVRKLTTEELPLSVEEARIEMERLNDIEARADFTDSDEDRSVQRVFVDADDEVLSSAAERITATHRDMQRLIASREGWQKQAAHECLSGLESTWITRYQELVDGIDAAEHLGVPSGTEISLNSEPGIMVRQAEQLRNYLTKGGKEIQLKPDGSAKISIFAAGIVKQCRPLLESVRVDGAAPVSVDDLTTFINFHKLSRELTVLKDVIPDAQVDQSWSANAQLSEFKRIAAALDSINDATSEARRVDAFLAQNNLPTLSWADPDSLSRYLDAISRAQRVREQESLRTAAEEARGDFAKYSRVINDSLESASESAKPFLYVAAQALEERDLDGYEYAVRELAALHSHEKEVYELYKRSKAFGPLGASVLDRVPHMNAPERSELVAHYEEYLPRVDEAQAWLRLKEQLDALERPDTETLYEEIHHADQVVQQHAAKLAELRAWGHAVSGHRLTHKARADLKNYVQQVSKLGKGTGKYAAHQRAEIRKTLDACRGSVPVWIMPLYRVTEQLNIQENMFDVVIVDEASQSSMSAVFLQFLAPKIVVIGDDKQVSPSDVGLKLDELYSLADQLIPNLPFKSSWTTAGRSLFDDANMRYGGQLTLTEHRRCVPEIIEFSNKIAYEKNGVPLIPVRQTHADRLPPFRTVYTPQGVYEGRPNNRYNEVEARAIVSHIKKCLKDRRYKGMTFGVISLLGTTQAEVIEKLLLAEIDTADLEKHQIMAGIAPDFQGAERDVIFLSMVVSPNGGNRFQPQTRDQDTQRYNVAVSRAKEQVWVFHSFQASDLSNKEDLRLQLLTYAESMVNKEDKAFSPIAERDPDPLFTSGFHKELYSTLNELGYVVHANYEAMEHTIDIVVEGTAERVAIACDGDTWNGSRELRAELHTQHELERCGWTFQRIWEQDFREDRPSCVRKLTDFLEKHGITPIPVDQRQARIPANGTATTDDDFELLFDSGSSTWTAEDDDLEFASDFAFTDALAENPFEGGQTANPFTDETWDAAETHDESDRDNPFFVSSSIEGLTENETPEDIHNPYELIEEEDLDSTADDNEDTAEASAESQDEDPAPRHRAGAPSFTTIEQSQGRKSEQPRSFRELSKRMASEEPPRSTPTHHSQNRSRKATDNHGKPVLFTPFRGSTVPVADATYEQITAGLVAVLEAEGPTRGARLFRQYTAGYGGRVGREVKRDLKRALNQAIRRDKILVSNVMDAHSPEDRSYYLPEHEPVVLRKGRDRYLRELPAEEVIAVMNLHADAETEDELFQQCKVFWGYGRLSEKGAAFLREHTHKSNWKA